MSCDERPRTQTDEGFTLAMVIVGIAVMAIFLGVAVQTVSFQMKREREAELIFRGEQYVEAIRLFKTKYGRYPMRLKELWEADPKVIRRKWKDPITRSENWGIVFLGQENMGGGMAGGGQDVLGPDGRPIIRPTGTPGFGARPSGSGRGDQNNGLPPGVTRNQDGELIGPIVGVHSTSCEDSVKVYEGRTSYCEWKFIFRENQQRGRGGRPGGGGPGGGGTGPRGFHGGENQDDFIDRVRGTPPPRPRATGTP